MADEEVFTYDDLYEILRQELSTKDLQPLETETIKKIKKYLDSKEELLSKSKSTKFLKEKRKLLDEIENARQILSKVYQKRIKKIITRAIFTIRSESGARDTSNMLPFEEEVYNKLIKNLEKSKEKFFSTVEEGKTEGSKPKSEKTKKEKKKEKKDKKKSKEKKEESKELKSKEKKESEKTKTKEIRMLEDIPELTGPNLKNYGPYKEGEVAELPAELAVLIINKGKARELKK